MVAEAAMAVVFIFIFMLCCGGCFHFPFHLLGILGRLGSKGPHWTEWAGLGSKGSLAEKPKSNSFSSQPKKQTHSFQWVLLGEDLVIYPNCGVGVASLIPKGTIVKGPGMALGYLFMVSKPKLSALEKS